jgi:Tfp pilus assembly PilM family ATPase
MAKKALVLGIELAAGTIRAALVDHSTREVLGLWSKVVENSPIENPGLLEEWLEQIQDEFPTEPNLITVAIPRLHAVVRMTTFPGEVEDAQDHLQWELAGMVNSPVDEYYWDTHDMGPDILEQGRLVAVAMVRKSIVDAFLQNFSKPHLVPQLMDIDVFCTLNALEVALPDAYAKDGLLVKADYQDIQIVRSNSGRIQQLVSIPTRSFQASLTEDAQKKLLVKYLNQLKRELKRVYDIAREDGMQNTEVILCGELLQIEGFFELIKNGLNVAVSFRELDTYTTLKFHSSVRNQSEVSRFAGAIGVALRRLGDKR